MLAVSNGTKQDVLFSTEDISAVALIPNVEKLEEESANNKEDEGSKKEPSVTDAEQALKKHKALPHDAVDLKIFTYEELVDEEERRAALQAFAVALGGVGRSMQASNAGYQSGYGTYNAYSPSGGSAFGSYNYSSYNYAAAQAAQSAAQAETDLEMSNAMANSEANLRHLRNTILKKHTLLPGETHGGIVQIQMPELSNNLAEVPVLLTVKVGKEEHQFYYQFTKNQ